MPYGLNLFSSETCTTHVELIDGPFRLKPQFSYKNRAVILPSLIMHGEHFSDLVIQSTCYCRTNSFASHFVLITRIETFLENGREDYFVGY